MSRRSKMESVQVLASQLLLLPFSDVERVGIKSRLSALYNAWDKICRQVGEEGRRREEGGEGGRGRKGDDLYTQSYTLT